MLDVHPPHAATHNWKDFFIHIATIVVGLLFATLELQVVHLDSIVTPNFGVFLTARANGKTSLLSTWQQNMQADLNRNADQLFISDLSFYRRLRGTLGELNQALLGRPYPLTRAYSIFLL